MGRIKEYYHEIICDGQITDIKDANDFIEWLGGHDKLRMYSPEELHNKIGDWKFQMDAEDMADLEQRSKD